jgi:hypothetical protein
MCYDRSLGTFGGKLEWLSQKQIDDPKNAIQIIAKWYCQNISASQSSCFFFLHIRYTHSLFLTLDLFMLDIIYLYDVGIQGTLNSLQIRSNKLEFVGLQIDVVL